MSHLELNKSIYRTLAESNFFKDYNIGVYFNVPSNASFPYVYMGSTNMVNLSTKSNSYFKIVNSLELYTLNNGDNIHLIIIEHIRRILTKENIKTKGLVNVELAGYESASKGEGKILHSLCKLNSYIEMKK